MGKDWNVLVVNDDVSTARLIADQLKPHRTRLAHTGQEAILMSGASPPELVVLDLHLSELSGIEAGRYLKRKFDDGSLPIMVVTASTDKASRMECSQIGCDYFLPVPYEVEELVTTANELIAVGVAEIQLMEAQRAHQAAAAEPNRKKRKKLEATLVEREPIEEKICQLRATIAARLRAYDRHEFSETHIARISQLRPAHPSLVGLRDGL